MTQVVTLIYPEPTIAVVEMADHTYRNTFSQPLSEGLVHTFEAIQQNPNVKVVVIHGYDNYFCCGGTQEELLKIFEGEIKFNDLAFYRVLLDCEIPTISAMQGHGIGDGLAFGCDYHRAGVGYA